MARKKVRSVETNNVRAMLKKPDVWVGLITVMLIAAIGVNSLKGKVRKILNPSPAVVSPGPLATVTPKPSIKVKPEVNETKKIIPAVIKKEKETISEFADTSSYYQVKEEDSYALISEKVCGSQQWFEQIAWENGYRELFPGDKLIVNCGE